MKLMDGGKGAAPRGIELLCGYFNPLLYKGFLGRPLWIVSISAYQCSSDWHIVDTVISVGQRGELVASLYVYTASHFCGELFSCSSLQLHLIPNRSLFNHPAQYHIIQIIRRYILWVQAHSTIFSRLRLSQLEGDAVDWGCYLFFEVYFPSGHFMR